MSKGFSGLVSKRFEGNDLMAREYVGDLGLAAYFYATRPKHAIDLLRPYAIWLPELFIWENGQVSDINWRSRSLIESRERWGIK